VDIAAPGQYIKLRAAKRYGLRRLTVSAGTSFASPLVALPRAARSYDPTSPTRKSAICGGYGGAAATGFTQGAGRLTLPRRWPRSRRSPDVPRLTAGALLHGGADRA
jgi:hypothetical protein